MQYKIIGGNTVSALERVVQMYIDDGWRPLGPPVFTPGQYYQAMTLEAKKENQ